MDDKHLPEETVTLPLPQLDPVGTAQAEGVATPIKQTPPAHEIAMATAPLEAPQVQQDSPGRVDSDALVPAEPTETRCSACKPEKGKTINTDEQGLCVVCGKKPKHAGGRPCKLCENTEKYLQITQTYIDKCLGRGKDEEGNKRKPQVPYIEELAILLSAHRETVMEWAKNEAEHPEFSDMLKVLVDIQALRLQQRLMGRFNPTGAIFLLKTKHRYIETEKQIIAGDKDEPLQIEVIEERPRNTDE